MVHPTISGSGYHSSLPPYQHRSSSILFDTVVTVALSAIALLSANAVSYSSPDLATFLRCVPFVFTLAWLFKRCFPSSSQQGHQGASHHHSHTHSSQAPVIPVIYPAHTTHATHTTTYVTNPPSSSFSSTPMYSVPQSPFSISFSAERSRTTSSLQRDAFGTYASSRRSTSLNYSSISKAISKYLSEFSAIWQSSSCSSGVSAGGNRRCSSTSSWSKVISRSCCRTG